MIDIVNLLANEFPQQKVRLCELKIIEGKETLIKWFNENWLFPTIITLLVALIIPIFQNIILLDNLGASLLLVMTLLLMIVFSAVLRE